MSELHEQIQAEWHEFKAANDRRLEEVEKFGEATAETTAMVETLNNSLTSLQSKMQDQIDDLETRLNRREMLNPTGGTISDEQRVLYANWQSQVQRKEVDPAHVDIDLITNYRDAFRDYLRNGERSKPESMQLLNAMSVGSDADGGYWVDPDTSGRIVELVYETSGIRQIASVETISTDALEGVADLGEAGSGWVGETEARPETDTPQIAEWRIPVHEQYAEPRTTQKVLDDARVNVENWLSGKVASRFDRTENTGFVAGDGIKRPRGFLTYAAGTPSVSNWDVIEQIPIGATSATIADGSADLLIDLVFSLKSSYRAGSVFGMTRLTEAEVRKIKDGNGNYLWQPDFRQIGASTMLGFPVIEMPDMPEITTDSLSVVFGNFMEAYQIVDRMGIRVLRDPYTSKPWVKFYSTKRVGGGVVNFEALKIGKVATA